MPPPPNGRFLFVVGDRKSTRLNSSHLGISYAVFCLKKKKKNVEHKHDHELVTDVQNVDDSRARTTRLDDDSDPLLFLREGLDQGQSVQGGLQRRPS